MISFRAETARRIMETLLSTQTNRTEEQFAESSVRLADLLIAEWGNKEEAKEAARFKPLEGAPV